MMDPRTCSDHGCAHRTTTNQCAASAFRYIEGLLKCPWNLVVGSGEPTLIPAPPVQPQLAVVPQEPVAIKIERRGGRRPGAGRKRKAKPAELVPAPAGELV